MSMLDNIAIASYIEELEKFLSDNAAKNLEERLRLLLLKLHKDKEAAKGGWL